MSKSSSYNLRTGLIKEKMSNVKKVSISFAAAAVISTGFAAPAFASGGGYCSNSSNGCTQSSSNTDCSGHGAFGAFSGTANNGQQGSEVHGYVIADQAAGTTLGAETGAANSSLCGNPQN